MANVEQLKLLRRGVPTWNAWRLKHNILPDLSGADLRGMNLEGINLYRANLSESNFEGADLVGANFDHAELFEANFRRANCTGADFLQAYLASADFRSANLSDASMEEADLSEIDFSYADLSELDLFGGFIWGATFCRNNLAATKHLETLQHQGPSSIDIETIYESEGRLPLQFLRGVGLPEDLIQHLKTRNWKTKYPSCFISYSSQDQAFVDQLHTSLQQAGVRCWLASEDLRIGDRFADRIEESISRFDKLLLVLSLNSIRSSWVEREVNAAFEKEKKRSRRNTLVPVRLDDAVMSSKKSWAAAIRRMRHIGDFDDWQNARKYEESLNRLLRDLQLGSQGSPNRHE